MNQVGGGLQQPFQVVEALADTFVGRKASFGDYS